MEALLVHRFTTNRVEILIPRPKVFLSWPWDIEKQTDPISSAGKHGGSHWIPFFVGADPIYLLVFAADPISIPF